jgi:hypothetical protein
MAAGTYILLDAESRRMTMVSPKEKTATVLPLGGLMSMMGGMDEAGLLKMDVTDISVSVDELGAGESILGHSTMRYRTRHSFSMSVAVMGFRRSSKEVTETDVWMASDLSVAEGKALDEFARNFSQSFSASGIGGEGMRKLTEELQRKMPKGFPLKQVAKRTSVDQGGKETSSTTTTEVTEYKRVTLDAKLFEVPAGYTLRDMSGVVDTASQSKKSVE